MCEESPRLRTDAVLQLIEAHRSEYELLAVKAAARETAEAYEAELRRLRRELTGIALLNPDNVNVPAFQETVRITFTRNEELDRLLREARAELAKLQQGN